jgi:hypothetical protein
VLTPSWEGANFIPNPGNSFPTLWIGASPHSSGIFTLPGFGWQVLFDSQHGSIGSKTIENLAKIGGGIARTRSTKKEKKKKKNWPQRI